LCKLNSACLHKLCICRARNFATSAVSIFPFQHEKIWKHDNQNIETVAPKQLTKAEQSDFRYLARL
jgi:hypothetical protein